MKATKAGRSVAFRLHGMRKVRATQSNILPNRKPAVFGREIVPQKTTA